jgi:hypothetical protein
VARAIAPFAVLEASLSACSGGIDDCGSDTDTVLQRPDDTAEIDVEVLEASRYVALNGAWYIQDDGSDPFPEPGTYSAAATQLDRIGDRVSLDFGDWRDVEVLRTYCM